MAVGMLSQEILSNVANSLVAQQKYANLEEALRDIALAAVRSKIAYYRRRIRTLERKYATDFDTFSVQLRGRAGVAEEDDWLAWRSAQSMLADWRKAYQELLHARPR